MKHRGNNEGSTRPIRPIKPKEDQFFKLEEELSQQIENYESRVRDQLNLSPNEEINWSNIPARVLLDVSAGADSEEIKKSFRRLIQIFHIDQYQGISPDIMNKAGYIQRNLIEAKKRLEDQFNEMQEKEFLSKDEACRLLDDLDTELRFWNNYRLKPGQTGISPFRLLDIHPGVSVEELEKAFDAAVFRFYVNFKPLFSESNILLSNKAKDNIHKRLSKILSQLQKARSILYPLILSQQAVRSELIKFRNPGYQPTIEELIVDLFNLGKARLSISDESVTGVQQAEIVRALNDELKKGTLTLCQIDRYSKLLENKSSLGFRLRDYVVSYLEVAVAEREIIDSTSVISLAEVERCLRILTRKYPGIQEDLNRLIKLKKVLDQPREVKKLLLNPETNFVTNQGSMLNNRIYSAIRKEWSVSQRLLNPVPDGLVYLDEN